MENSYQNNLHNKSKFLLLLVFVFTVLIPFVSKSQVLQTESFESTIFPAPGWKQGKGITTVNGAFIRQPVGSATNPTAAATAGANVMMLNSSSATNGDSAFMYSKPFDFSSAGAATPTFSFQMYRDNGFAGNADEVQVFINTSPTIVGATPVNHGGGISFIRRPNTALPVATANTWNTYTFNVPAAFVNAPKKSYIIILGRCLGGLNIYIDDFRVNTYPSPAAVGDVSFNLIQQNFASVGQNTTDQWIIGVRCVVAGNSGCGSIALGSAIKLDSLLFNSNGTNNINDIQNAKVWYTGGSQQFSTGYISPFPVLTGSRYPSTNYGSTIGIPATNLDFFNNTGAPVNCFHLEYDTTYFWLTYDIKNTAVGGNFVDADFRGAVITPGGGSCPTPSGNATTITASTTVFEIQGGPQVDLPYCVPTYTTGTAWANYTNNDYVHQVEFITGVPPAFINTLVNSPAVQSPAAPCFPTLSCPFAGHPPDYELRPTSGQYGGSVILTQGQNYSFRARCGTWSSANYIQAWIDYNRNGLFEATERCVATPSNLTSLTWQTFTASVPAVGYTGNTRLRVREVFATSTIDPCQNYTYGECEDFNITILPNCPAGFKLWLGNTSNWADPSNWCGGIPTSSDSVRIDRSAPQFATITRAYFKPVILSGTKANTRSIFISSIDTLEINAPNPADTALRIHGNLWNSGNFIVRSGFSNTVVISTGTIANNIYTPFRGSVSDSRCQILYSAAELTAQGLVPNDRITQISFNTTKNSAGTYQNFTISYGFLAAGTVQFASNVPVATPNTVFGPVTFATVSGANTITLTNPIVWNGTDALVIQYCFDNPASIGGNDVISITQTTGRRTVLLLTNNLGSPTGCTLTIPSTGTTDNFFTSAAINRPNFSFFVDRTYGKPLVGIKGDWNNNGRFTAGNSQVIFDSLAAQNIQGTSTSTFHELNIKKTAIANTVTLQLNTTVSDTLLVSQGQLVMNKKSLNITNPAGASMNGAAAGVVTGNFNGAITRPANGGVIVSEDSLSKVNWTTTSVALGSFVYRVVPFGNSAGTYIPFSFAQKNGDLGVFTVATYPTIANNTPLPPTVSHINSGTAVTTAVSAIDRFWITSKTSTTSPTVDFAFRWAQTEKTSVSPVLNTITNIPRAYPWRISPNNMGAWLKLYTAPVNTLQLATAAGYTFAPFLGTGTSPDSVRIASFDYPTVVAGLAPFFATTGPMPNYLPWSVAGSTLAGALPVELLSFNAAQIGKKVKLDWSTASEINNDYFVVERSDADQIQFDFITKVRSWFNNSTSPLYYEAWDDKPLEGLSYYRLKQVDLDGKYTYSSPVPVMFNPALDNPMPFDLLNTYADQLSTGNINVEFSYNSEAPITFTIADATGRIVATGSGIAATPGINRITLNQPLTRGMYIMTLRNEKESVSRRFVY